LFNGIDIMFHVMLKRILSTINWLKMTVLIYLGLSKLIFLKRLENILTFQSFNKNSVLADYYFDIGTLYTIERLNERIIIKDDHIYVVYNKNNVYYNPLTEAFYALVFYQRKNTIFF
jgi:hypothetical protein